MNIFKSSKNINPILENKRNLKLQKILFVFFPVLLIFVLLMSFYTGYYYKTIEYYETETTDIRFVTELVDKHYNLKEYDKEFAEYSAINAYLDTLGDKYATYLTAEEQSKKNDYRNGINTSLGIVFSINKDEKLVIKDFDKDGNAKDSGLQIDDIILSINNFKIASYEDYIKFYSSTTFKNEEKVKVSVLRKNKELSFTVIVTEKKFETCEFETIDDLLYIKLHLFSSKSASILKEELTKKLSSNNNLKGIILDLRDNGGGELTAMQTVSGCFLNEKLIATFKYKNDEEKIYSLGNKAYNELPLVVLVNENSASASECLTGALQTHKRATIVGTQTFGKGIGQSTYKCPNGGFVTFTTSKYYLPNGECIHEKGITPNVLVQLPEEILNGKTELTHENDTQLQKAIEILK